MVNIFPSGWFQMSDEEQDEYARNNNLIEDIQPTDLDSILSYTLESQSDFDDKYTEDSIEFYKSLNEAVKADTISKFEKLAAETYKNYSIAYQAKARRFTKALAIRIKEDYDAIEPYKDDLKKFIDTNKTSIELPNTRYEYTNIFDDKIPSMDAYETLKDIKIKVEDIIKFEGSNNDKLKLLKDEYQELTDYIKSGKCFSEARGKLLGSNKSISIEKFTTEIFNVFRAGGNVLSEQVSPKEIKEAYNRFYKYPELLNNLANNRRDIQKGYNLFLKDIRDLDIVKLKSYFGKGSQEFEKFYALYIKLRLDQIIKISLLQDQVYAAKLQAIVDSYLQDKAIMIAACGRLQQTDEDNNKLYIDIIVDEYAELIINENYNAIRMHLAMLEALGEEDITINESTIISLDEAAFGNLKNFLIGICKKISDVIERFTFRLQELTKANQRFFEGNKDKILSNVTIKETATFTNYYSYNNLMKNLAAITFKGVSSAEIEAKAEANQWQTPEDYFKTDGKPSLEGFVYNTTGGSIKEQVEDALRGKAREISSNQVNAQVRGNLYNYCTNDFSQIKSLTDADLAALKQFGQAMDTYLATSANNNGDQVEFNSEVNVRSSSEVQAQNASFSYEDTMTYYFNEVEIKQDGSPNANGVPKNQAAANADNQKAEANAKKEQDAKISKAVKSYIKANSQMLSAKMNIAVEAYRQSTKILKWYVTQYNNQTGENKNENKGKNTGNNNETISGAIG